MSGFLKAQLAPSCHGLNTRDSAREPSLLFVTPSVIRHPQALHTLQISVTAVYQLVRRNTG